MPGRITQVLRLRITSRESVAFIDERAGLLLNTRVLRERYPR
ncbi:MAG: hypothetical protein Q8O70_01740 [Burkholderiales bacterium]|nr:hypothetical protein [Burkholderiales bacterium]